MTFTHRTSETANGFHAAHAAAGATTADSHLPPPPVLRGREGVRLVSFGILSWLPVFAVGTALQAWRQLDFPLFEACLVVTTAAATAFFASADLHERQVATLRRGVLTGLTWCGVHAALGAMAFVGGPLEMPMVHFRALLVGMLVIPTITLGIAHQASQQGPRPRPDGAGP